MWCDRGKGTITWHQRFAVKAKNMILWKKGTVFMMNIDRVQEVQEYNS